MISLEIDDTNWICQDYPLLVDIPYWSIHSLDVIKPSYASYIRHYFHWAFSVLTELDGSSQNVKLPLKDSVSSSDCL